MSSTVCFYIIFKWTGLEIGANIIPYMNSVWKKAIFIFSSSAGNVFKCVMWLSCTRVLVNEEDYFLATYGAYCFERYKHK